MKPNERNKRNLPVNVVRSADGVPFSAVRAATFYVHCRMDAPPVFDAGLTEDEVHQLHFPTARPRFSSVAWVVAVLAVFWSLVLLACWFFQLFPFN